LLTKKLGLIIAGIDLIITNSGECYCLEANPSPGFSYFDISDKKNIARAVAEALYI
jgi:D-alanine-D-alanine ligase-like ATP-grasp enzyme